jgi:biotin transport system substrate-specific component
MSTSASPTLLDALTSWRLPDAQRGVRLATVLLMAVLTAAAAQFSVPLPFTQVPLTLQPTIVLLGGLVLGSRLGPASQGLYLIAGLVGLPVFAASLTLPPGPLRLLGPTGGYLMVYPLAAYVTGLLAERGFDRGYATSLLAMLAGLVVIYGGGVIWLGLFARMGGESAALGLGAALTAGVYPFVLSDLLKTAVAAALAPTVWRAIGR